MEKEEAEYQRARDQRYDGKQIEPKVEEEEGKRHRRRKRKRVYLGG